MATETGKIVLQFTGYKYGSEDGSKGTLGNIVPIFQKKSGKKPQKRTFLVEIYDGKNRRIYDNVSNDTYVLKNDEYILTYYNHDDTSTKGPKKEHRKIIKLNRTNLYLTKWDERTNKTVRVESNELKSINSVKLINGIEIETSALGLECTKKIIIYPNLLAEKGTGPEDQWRFLSESASGAKVSVLGLFDILKFYAYGAEPDENQNSSKFKDFETNRKTLDITPSQANIVAPTSAGTGGKRKRRRTMRKRRRHSTTRRHKKRRRRTHKKHTKGRRRHTKGRRRHTKGRRRHTKGRRRHTN